MSLGIRLVWLLQGLLLLAIGGTLVVDPAAATTWLPGLDGLDGLVERQLVGLFAPLGLGLGALTLQVLRPSFSWLRESLSGTFFASWVVAFVVAALFDGPWPLLVGSTFFALCNLAYVLRDDEFDTPHSARPSASAEAPMLGHIWGLQMVYYAGCAVALLVWPDWVIDLLLPTHGDHDHALSAQILRSASPLYFGMAFLSHQAIGAQSDETWRGYCQAFLTAQWACVIAMLIAVADKQFVFGPWTLAIIVPNAALALNNTLTLYDRRFIRRSTTRLRGSLHVWWTLQALLMLIVAWVTWIMADVVIADFQPAVPDDGTGQDALSEDAFRLVAPLALGLVALTVMALLRRDRRSRHDFAQLFLVWGAAALLAFLVNDSVKIFSETFFFIVLTPVLLALAGLITLTNLMVWLFPDWRSSDEQYRGAADTKPRWVYRLCVWQGVLFAVLATALLFFPAWMATVVLSSEPDASEIAPLLTTTLRGTAPFWAVMAGASWFAASASHEWSWRGLCRWTALWQIAYVITFAYIFDSHLYAQVVLAWPTLLGALILLNLSAASVPLRATDLAGQPRPSGMLLTDLGPGLPLIHRTMIGRARAYHRVGVGATGTFQPDPSHVLPHASFLDIRQQPLLCTVRFSNAQLPDDAALDARGCAISLSWPDSTERLDLLMSTGAFGCVRNVAQAMAVRWAPARMHRRWLRTSHAAREAAIATHRRAPASYAELTYHTQLVSLWVGYDARGQSEGRRCRLRLRPEACELESGLPDAADEDAPWETDRRPGETRAPDYLRHELPERLGAGPVRMCLEAQIGPAPPGGSQAIDDAGPWYDATVDWDETVFPWHAVGTLVLDRALPASATEFLTFDPGQGGGVLAVPRSGSWRDERSLAATQVRVIQVLVRLRLWIYRMLRRDRRVEPES